MVLSFAARRARGDSRQSLMKHAARRSALILLIGYAIRILPFFNFSHMRYPGVLQRIAIVYLFASVITLWTSTRGRILWIAGLLAGYYAVMRFVPVPGCDPAAWMTQHCSLAGFIDRKLMLGHLYRRDFDPEGLLSTFPQSPPRCWERSLENFCAAPQAFDTNCAALPLPVLRASLPATRGISAFPSPSRCGRSSYVLFTAGAACLLLALCWWLIEMRGWRSGRGPSSGWDQTPSWLMRSPRSSQNWVPLSKWPTESPLQTWVYEHWFAPLAQTRRMRRWPSPFATWRCGHWWPGLCTARRFL